MAGTFQVYCVEGRNNKIDDGFLAISDDSKQLVFDEDFLGFEAADTKYRD